MLLAANFFQENEEDPEKSIFTINGIKFLLNEIDLDNYEPYQRINELTDTDAFIFFIDVTDMERYPEARNRLWRIMKFYRRKRKYPIEIFLNKVDLLSEEEFNQFTLQMFVNQKSRNITVHYTSIFSPEFSLKAFKDLILKIDIVENNK